MIRYYINLYQILSNVELPIFEASNQDLHLKPLTRSSPYENPRIPNQPEQMIIGNMGITIRNPTIDVYGGLCQHYTEKGAYRRRHLCKGSLNPAPSCLHHLHKHTLGKTSGTKCLAYAVS